MQEGQVSQWAEMKRGLLFCCIFLLVPCLPIRVAYAKGESCSDITSGASDVSLKLTLKDGRFLYHEGEIIPLELEFRSIAEKNTALILAITIEAGG